MAEETFLALRPILFPLRVSSFAVSNNTNLISLGYKSSEPEYHDGTAVAVRVISYVCILCSALLYRLFLVAVA
jgi:hypothetical protein